MKNQTVVLVCLLVEVFCIVRSAIASFNVTMSLSNDVTFSIFTVAVVELSLFAMLLMSGAEAVAPIAALVLIAFSAVLQYAELAIITGAMDEQSKMILRYAVSFAPTVLLLVGLLKRLTSKEGAHSVQSSLGDVFGGIVRGARDLFGGSHSGQEARAFNDETEKNSWVETRKVKRWRDANGRTRSKYVPSGKGRKARGAKS